MKRKIFSILFTLVLAVSLILVPAAVSASPGGIELVATGDSTAEWVTAPVKMGSYAVKLNWNPVPSDSNAEVQIDVSEQGLTLAEMSWSFWTLTPAGMESYALPIEFYVDLDGDGTADKIIAGNILKKAVPATDEWYEMNPELWKDYGGAFYVWRGDGTGFDFSVGADPWAGAIEKWGNTEWGNAKIVRVDLGYGPLGTNEAVTAYVDNLTINGVIYELEPSSDVSLAIETEQITAISVTPTSIDFGTIKPGNAVSGNDITVENIGTVTVVVDASLEPLTGTVFNYLRLGGAYSPSYSGLWDDIISGLLPSISKSLTTELDVPSTYSARGAETATLIFEATAK